MPKLLPFLLLALLGHLPAAEINSGEPTNAKEAAAKAKVELSEQELAADTQRMATLSPEAKAWEKVLEVNLGNFYLPIYKRDKIANKETPWDYVRDDPALPRLLIIGDSISRGYTVPTRHALAGKVNVHRAPANCGPTAMGIKNLDRWLGTEPWDVIHVNFGIHDRATKPEDYAARLETLLGRLQKTGAKIIWARTTPAPPSSPQFSQEECQRVNEIADRIMQAHQIPTTDLYTLLAPKLADLQVPNDVHFKGAGYVLMGQAVAASVLKALDK